VTGTGGENKERLEINNEGLKIYRQAFMSRLENKKWSRLTTRTIAKLN
jgi:hypothetical protein